MHQDDHQGIEIEELTEAGDDGGSHMGWYARGHHDKNAFADACNKRSRAFNTTDRSHVLPRHVRHVWWRTGQMAGEPRGTMCFHVANPGDKGAWQATVAEPLQEWADRQHAMRIREFERGKRAGYEAALMWLVMCVEYGSGMPMTLDDLEARRKLVADVRAAYSPASIDADMKDKSIP